jgi:hypothetical protein
MAHRAGTSDFCPALAVLVGSVENIFDSPFTISLHWSPGAMINFFIKTLCFFSRSKDLVANATLFGYLFHIHVQYGG